MAIEMAGSVYCSLSPRDPQHRLHSLLEQTQSRFVLVHYLTKTKFNDDIVTLDIDSVLTENDVESHVDVDSLSNVRDVQGLKEVNLLHVNYQFCRKVHQQ